MRTKIAVYLIGFAIVSCKETLVTPGPNATRVEESSSTHSVEQSLADSGILQLAGSSTDPTFSVPSTAPFPLGALAFVPTHYNMSVAIAPDGSIYWTEFGKMRLMRYTSKGLEIVLANTPGLYGVIVDARGRVYVGQDMSDHPFNGGPDAGKFQGSVSRVDFDKANRAMLTKVIKYVRRPRQLLMDGTTIFLTLEAERRIISCSNADTRTSPCIPKPTGENPKSYDDRNYFKTELTTNAISPPNGLGG